MARVWLAEETALRRKVVVKVLPSDVMAGVSVDRFKREILLAAALQHPHIVPVLTAGETSGVPFYTMPFVDGESLRAHLTRGAMPITNAIGILRDVAKALAYAHERGIVHRDIKPDNVLLTGGSATVTDFGIAKAISAARTDAPGGTLTHVGTSIGTPAYMAPEQAAADPDTDHRADIYSFGCLAYEILAGRPPFIESTPRRLLAAHMGVRPSELAELRPDVPVALGALVMRCLEKEANLRPQSATEIVRALELVTSGGSQPAMPRVLLGGPRAMRRALLVYAVAFAAVAILTRAAITGIGLPEWVFPGALIVMALGLPAILATGYVSRVAHRAWTATPTFTPGGTPSLASGTMATMAMKASPHVSWRRTAIAGAVSVGVFVLGVGGFMTMRAYGIGPAGSLLAAGKLDGGDPILLADFRTSNIDSTLGRVVGEAVRQGLSESASISLISPADVVAALRRMEQPAAVKLDSALAQALAQRNGIKAIIHGEIAGVGPTGYIVTLRLVNSSDGTQLGTVRAAGDGSQGLIDAADESARALRARIGESLRRVNATPSLANVTTSSLPALRKYTEASRANALGDPRSAAA
jgi:hypothetical protein